jgi:hypothetical protein
MDPGNCRNTRHCITSDSGFIMFVLEEASYVGLSIIPNRTDADYSARIEYRLINV